jgi:helicase
MALLSAFIGIDRYRDDRIRDLTGAKRDATALWALFSDTLPDITASIVTDEDATLARVRQALDETLGAAGADDIVVLTFAGHGTPDHRFVVADSDYENLSPTTLDMGELARRFRETKAKAVICLLDCCFSGGAPARVLENAAIPRDSGIPLVEIAGRGRILLAASNTDEPALEDPVTRHGLFTKAVMDGLVAGPNAISVVALVDVVVRDVRAAAAKFGQVQTPVMFGHIEGELSLPALHRGAHFAAAFPTQPAVQVSSAFADLAVYGISTPVLDAWATRYPTGLNQLQLTAINEHGILNGTSLLVVAPTSAGKTFVGEVAAIKAIAQGQKAVFLLPYKALVNEKYADFSELYGAALGLRVVRCSGDWQDQVGQFLRGKYDIAFLTYEKFLGLSLAAPYILNQLGLVVLDEAQFIAEPGRGMTVELLLTSLVSARARGIAPQIIALSAVIGNTNSLERWLGSELLIATNRPVPLIEGVIDRSGIRQHRAVDGQQIVAEFLPSNLIRQRRDKPSSQDVIVPLVRKLVAEGEKVIVFRNARGPASGCAQYLAAELGLPAAESVLEVLPERDPSSTSEQLRRSLQGGVAFHSSDLSREERTAVETAFRNPDGQVRVLVATTTVAAGVNTPASTVIIVETQFFSGDGPIPFTVAQYKNMAGRAGRLGFEIEGKAILIADTPMERDRFFRRYVLGEPDRVTSSFDPRHPETWVIRLLAQVADVTREQILELVANTYGGFLAAMAEQGWRARIGPQVTSLIDRMLTDGLLEAEGDKLRLTMLGRACGESPLAFESAMRLVEMIRLSGADNIGAETLMALIQALPEQDADYTPMARGQSETVRPAAVATRFGQAVAGALRRRASSDSVYYARCKRALVLADWIGGVPLQEIERRYSPNAFARVGHGDIRGYADGTRFLLEPVLRIAAIVREGQEPDPETTEQFLKRLDIGLPTEALPLTVLPGNFMRGDYLALWNAGLRSPEDVAALPSDVLVRMVGRENTATIQEIAEIL